MNEIALVFAAFFGATGIIFGAFGAHVLKKKLTNEQLQSFETGVKYQIYHALVLLVLGFQYRFVFLFNLWTGAFQCKQQKIALLGANDSFRRIVTSLGMGITNVPVCFGALIFPKENPDPLFLKRSSSV